MKKVISILMLTLSSASFASCLVELAPSGEEFAAGECREAMQECNRYLRSHQYTAHRCIIKQEDSSVNLPGSSPIPSAQIYNRI